MSFWYYRKAKDGKSSVYSITVPLELIFLLVGLLFGILSPRYFMDSRQFGFDSIILIILGFSLFFVSKASLFIQGIWNSWGPKMMRKQFKWAYYSGYMLMISGSLGSLLFYQIH